MRLSFLILMSVTFAPPTSCHLKCDILNQAKMKLAIQANLLQSTTCLIKLIQSLSYPWKLCQLCCLLNDNDAM